MENEWEWMEIMPRLHELEESWIMEQKELLERIDEVHYQTQSVQAFSSKRNSSGINVTLITTQEESQDFLLCNAFVW